MTQDLPLYSSDDQNEYITVRASMATGLHFVIRLVGRFTLFAGPELREHFAGEGDGFIFAADLGIGVGLGGE